MFQSLLSLVSTLRDGKRGRSGTFAALALMAALIPAAGQDMAGVGSISGIVLDSNKQPVAGVTVCAVGSTRCAESGQTGAFRLSELRPGSFSLEIKPAGGPPIRSGGIEVHAGLEAKVDVTLPEISALQQSVTVSESVFVPPEEVKNSSFLIQPAEIFKSAGALQDVSRYVQTLPGVVVGSDDFRNDIIVRGGSPLENLFIVDNIEIPNINTFANFASAGGAFSILDAALIADVTFLTGGYPAPYVNRASSVLQVAQREGSRERFGGRATLGFAGLGTILEGPIRREKGSWIVSLRRSFLDAFTDDVGFGGVPVTYTLNAKALYDLSPRDRVWAVSVSGADRIRLGAREGNEKEDELYNFDIRYSGWRNATGFNWQRLFGERGVGVLGVSHSEASIGSTVRDLVRNGIPPAGAGLDQVIAGSPVIFREDSREGESTVKYDFTSYAAGMGKMQAGGTYKIFTITYDTASPLGYDSPYSTARDLNPFDLRKSFRAYQGGAYFQTSRNLTSRLNLTWGGRLDNYRYIGSTRFSPRAGLSYRLTNKLSWKASYGTYYQQPFFFFLATFPENRGLAPFRADHYVSGFSYIASPTLRFSLEAYRKDYKDYPVSLQFPGLSLANAGDTFNVRDILFPMTSAGRGRVQGVEFFLEKKFTRRWFGQANIAYSRTRHAGLDGIRRPGAFDYPFVFNTVGGYRLSKNWELSMRMAYLTGRPYTPFDESLSRGQRRAIFDVARVNQERLPDYFRLDLRVDRTFTFRDKPLLIFAGAQNVTNRKNIAGFNWNRRLNTREVNEQLGLFPLIGMEWRF